MTTYTEDSPEPGPEVTEVWDRDGDRWQRNHVPVGAVDYPPGWLQADERTTRASRFPMSWAAVSDWAPLTDEPPEGDSSSATITPEIRSAALGHAIAAHSAIVGNLNDVELQLWGEMNAKSLYEMADRYAGYIATGEHPK